MATSNRRMRIVTREELIEIARAIVEINGGQRAMARTLDVSQAAVWQALQADGGGMDALRRRIVERGGFTVLDDHFAVIEPSKRSQRGDTS